MKIDVTICYARTTPESVDDGDFSETGIQEEFTVTEADLDDETIVDYLAKYAERNGFYMFSSSVWYAHGWYSTGFYTVAYTTGEEEEQTLHVKGLTEEQSRALYQKITEK